MNMRRDCFISTAVMPYVVIVTAVGMNPTCIKSSTIPSPAELEALAIDALTPEGHQKVSYTVRNTYPVIARDIDIHIHRERDRVQKR